MEIAVSNRVDTVLLMQQAQVGQEVQTRVLKQAMEAQASMMLELVQSVAPTPELASEGMVGTRINTFA